MVEFRKSKDRDHKIDLSNAPDSLIPDNFDDYLARVAIHGTAGGCAEERKSTPLPRDPIDDMTDRYIPDNFDEIMQRIYEHGVIERRHHTEQGLSEQDYLQTVANTITAPSVIIELQQHGGPTWIYSSEFGDTEQVVVVPSKYGE